MIQVDEVTLGQDSGSVGVELLTLDIDSYASLCLPDPSLSFIELYFSIFFYIL